VWRREVRPAEAHLAVKMTDRVARLQPAGIHQQRLGIVPLANQRKEAEGRRITLSRPSGTTITGAGTGRGPRLASGCEW
jgi:hypothetical protein